MHLLLVNRWYPPYTGYGGVAAYNDCLAHALVGRGHQVTMLAARWSVSDPALQQDSGVRVIRLLARHHARLQRLPLLGRYMRPFSQWRYSRRVAAEVVRLAGAMRVDLAEFAEVNAEGFCYLHAQPRLPVVVRCHTPTFVLRQYYQPAELPYDTVLSSSMEQYCITHADALSAPSADMAGIIEHACHLNKDSVSVIANPLDLVRFPATAKAAGNSASVNILHVGRLDRIKGIEVLIKAAPRVLAECPQVRFMLAGGGSAAYMGYLRQLQSTLGLSSDHFQFLGEVTPETLSALYHEADIAVVPTLNYESFSYTVAQAMASGLPVVASRVGGIPETVGSEGAALLVAPGHVEQLGSALVELCLNPVQRRRMGLAGRARAESYFESAVVADKMLTLYHSLLAG